MESRDRKLESWNEIVSTKQPRVLSAVRCLLLVLTALAFVLVCTGITAQQPARPQKEGSADKKLEEVEISFKHLRRDLGDKRVTFVEGDVKCVHGDTTLTTESATVDEREQIVTVPGKITITNPECDITADKGTAYLKKGLAVLEGNVVMRLKPKKSEEEASKDSERARFTQPTTITCARIEYQYRKKIASGSGNVVFKQEKRTATAQRFTYDEKNEILTVMGGVKAVDEEGQTFSAPDKVIICLKKGSEYMEASNATATIKVDMSEEE